jgi:hypothetical protein
MSGWRVGIMMEGCQNSDIRFLGFIKIAYDHRTGGNPRKT